MQHRFTLWERRTLLLPGGTHTGPVVAALPAQSQESLMLRQGLGWAVSASLSVLGKSFTEMGLGIDFKGSRSEDLLIV